MKGTKSVWESKTIWACVTALAAALMSIVNHYAGDTPLADDALLSSFVAAVSATLGIVFRATADHKLTVRAKEKLTKIDNTSEETSDGEPNEDAE
jgi:hypothetical protein